MALHLTPDMGVAIEPQQYIPDLMVSIGAAATTTEILANYGLEFDDTATADEQAAAILHAYAESPENAAKRYNDKALATLQPASVQQVRLLLKEFSNPVVETAVQIRNLVINKLLIESDNPDPRVRVKALELLGKVSDVSLFSEKTEVTVTHQTTDDLRRSLRERLARLSRPAIFEEDDVIDVIPVSIEPSDAN